MQISLPRARKALDKAVNVLFKSDPRVRSVGIGRHGNGYGFRVVRNAAQVLPMSARVGAKLSAVQDIPCTWVDRHTDVHSLVRVPLSQPGGLMATSLVPERAQHRPLVCGLQIENFDDDTRTGTIAGGHIIIGTLGCFGRLTTGKVVLLSNNHVVAGENRGKKGKDRITQPGTGVLTAGGLVAVLGNYRRVKPSPAGATPAAGNVVFNDIDAGLAVLKPGLASTQGYLALRSLPRPSGTAIPEVGDRVFKVGRTTGLTHGEITDVATVVGPIPYGPGPCWFRRSFTIVGVGGATFSDHGDSGSAIVREGTNEVLGLLYAGNGFETYACAIDAVIKALKCSLV